MTVKVTQVKVIGTATIRQAIYHLLLVVCSKKVSTVHCVRDITRFTACVAAVTIRSPSVSIGLLKLQTMCTSNS